MFVENGQLHRDPWQIRKMLRRFGGAVFLVLVIKINQHIAMHAIPRQQDQHNEIRNQQRHIKGVGLIQAFKRGIEEMLANVWPNALRRRKSGNCGERIG